MIRHDPTHDLKQHGANGTNGMGRGFSGRIIAAVLALTLALLLLEAVQAYRELRAVGRAHDDDTLWAVLSFDADMERMSAILAMGLIENVNGAQAVEQIRLPFASYRNRLEQLQSHMGRLEQTGTFERDPRPLLADLFALAVDFDSKLASGVFSQVAERQVMARRLAQLMPQVNAFSMGAMTHMAQQLMASQRATEWRLILIVALILAVAVQVAAILLLMRKASAQPAPQAALGSEAAVVARGVGRPVSAAPPLLGAAPDSPASAYFEPQSHHEAFAHLLEVLDRARLRAIYAALHQDLDQVLRAHGEAGHDQALRHQIHQCGGSAAMLGFAGLHQACYDLETGLGRDPDLPKYAPEWQSFIRALAEVRPVLRDFIAALQPGAA